MNKKHKVGKMQITFSKDHAEFLWDSLIGKLKNDICPFCNQKVTPESLGGFAFIDGQPRAFDNSLPCILEFSKYETESE